MFKFARMVHVVLLLGFSGFLLGCFSQPPKVKLTPNEPASKVVLHRGHQFDKRAASFKIRPSLASELIRQYYLANGDKCFHWGEDIYVIIGRYYEIPPLDKFRIFLRGYYISGDTGKIEYRDDSRFICGNIFGNMTLHELQPPRSTPDIAIAPVPLQEITDLSTRHILNLTDTHLTEAGLSRLQDLPLLTTLNLTGTNLTDAALKNLQKLNSLQTLVLTRTQITDLSLVYLQPLTQLTDLNLSLTKITDSGLEELKYLPHLHQLNLSGTTITGATLVNLDALQELRLVGTPMTDAGLAHLVTLKNLRLLDLRGTKITNAGLGKINQLANLEYLDLSDTHITDSGLKQLKDLQKLRSIYINWRDRGEKSAKYLETILPNCRVSSHH